MANDEPTDATHACAAPGCPTRLPHSMLMCMRHWRMVPRDLQRRLTDAYERAPRGGGRAVLTTEYVDAMTACVDAVRGR